MLRDVLTKSRDRDEAKQALKKWYSWARHCHLGPFKRFAVNLKALCEGTLNRFDSRLSKDVVEGMKAQTEACGGMRPLLSARQKNLNTVSYLVCRNPSQLRASSYRTTSKAAVA